MNRVKILANSMKDLLPDFAVLFGIDIVLDVIIYGEKNYWNIPVLRWSAP